MQVKSDEQSAKIIFLFFSDFRMEWTAAKSNRQSAKKNFEDPHYFWIWKTLIRVFFRFKFEYQSDRANNIHMV